MPCSKLSVYVENLEADGSSSRSNHLNYLQNSVSTQIVDLTDVESPSNSTSDNSTQRYDTGTGQAQQEAQNISSTSIKKEMANLGKQQNEALQKRLLEEGGKIISEQTMLEDELVIQDEDFVPDDLED